MSFSLVSEKKTVDKLGIQSHREKFLSEFKASLQEDPDGNLSQQEENYHVTPNSVSSDFFHWISVSKRAFLMFAEQIRFRKLHWSRHGIEIFTKG